MITEQQHENWLHLRYLLVAKKLRKALDKETDGLAPEDDAYIREYLSENFEFMRKK